MSEDREDSRRPSSLTGGAGFTLEDRIGAWLAAAMIAGESPLGVDFGPISEIQFQTAEPLDDVKVTASNSGRTWSASIKSFDLLTNSHLNDEFIDEAWGQMALDKFESDSLVGFACGPVAQGTLRQLEKLIATARHDSPENL